ncbi:MAG: hypothetical protein WD793_11700 [Steroidobacteraceae bacterium]
MKRQIALLLSATLALALPGLASANAEHATGSAASVTLTDAKAAQRDLWIGHVFWVRNVVDARFEGNANEAKVAEQQVVANAKAIAASIEPFYGKAASEKLFTLLAGHWGAISDYLDATRANRKAGQDAAFKQLVANADEIAVFLGGANPNLPVDVLKGLLMAHGSHHVQQIGEFKAKRFDAEAKTWAAMTHHMYVIADALAEGIAKQFPDKFR